MVSLKIDLPEEAFSALLDWRSGPLDSRATDPVCFLASDKPPSPPHYAAGLCLTGCTGKDSGQPARCLRSWRSPTG